MKNINTSALVRKADASLDTCALFDALLIALMFTLIGSKFISAPGLALETDSLPTISTNGGSLTDGELTVLTVKSDSMLIFDGRIYDMKSFAEKAESSKAADKDSVLLVKAGKEVTSQTLIDICTAAKKAGYRRIQIAAKPTKFAE